MKFEIELPWDVEPFGTMNLIVMGTYDCAQAYRRSHPDLWREAWSEIVVDNIYACGKKMSLVEKMKFLDDEKFLAAVEKEITGRNSGLIGT